MIPLLAVIVSLLLFATGLFLWGFLRKVPVPGGGMTLYGGAVYPRQGLLAIIAGILLLVWALQTGFSLRSDYTAPVFSVEGPTGAVPTGRVDFNWQGTDNRTPADRLTYRYRLTGTSERAGYPRGDWSPWGKHQGVTFGQVLKGNYTFTVQARDEAGNIGDVAVTFQVE